MPWGDEDLSEGVGRVGRIRAPGTPSSSLQGGSDGQVTRRQRAEAACEGRMRS